MSSLLVIPGGYRYRTTVEEVPVDDEDDLIDPIQVNNTGKTHMRNILVPANQHGRVIGRKGANVKEMHANFPGAKVLVPKKGTGVDMVTVTARSFADLDAIERHIMDLVGKTAPVSKPTHFFSIPVHALVESEFSKWSQEIGCRKDMQSAHKLHMTLGVVSTKDEEETKETLLGLADEIRACCDDRPLDFLFQGLRTFSDCSPTSTRVVFIEPKPQGDAAVRFKRLGQLVAKTFGLEGRAVTNEAHVTVIKGSRTIDASVMIDKSAERRFGRGLLSTLHLCRIDDAHTSVAHLALPQ